MCLGHFLRTFMQLWLGGSLMMAQAGSMEICQWEDFKADCDDGSVVMMLSAKYGIMDTHNRCLDPLPDGVPCQKDALRVVDSICSGRQSCTLTVPNQQLENLKPCGPLKSYLEALSHCVAVEASRSKQCRRCDDHNTTLQKPHGFLSSYYAFENGCGLQACPWRIVGPTASRIKLELWDFFPPPNEDTYPTHPCELQVEVMEDGHKTWRKTFCGETYERPYKRHSSNFFTSKTNAIQLSVSRMLSNTMSTAPSAHFMLYYLILRCPVLAPPENGWLMETDDGGMKMGCNFSEAVETILTCNGTHWNGNYVNCPYSESGGTYLGGGDKQEWTKDQGLIIAIMAAVAIVVCSIVVVIGLFCMSARNGRRQYASNRDRYSYEPAYKRTVPDDADNLPLPPIPSPYDHQDPTFHHGPGPCYSDFTDTIRASPVNTCKIHGPFRFDRDSANAFDCVNSPTPTSNIKVTL